MIPSLGTYQELTVLKVFLVLNWSFVNQVSRLKVPWSYLTTIAAVPVVQPTGTISTVRGTHLHFNYSCYIFDQSGTLLLYYFDPWDLYGLITSRRPEPWTDGDDMYMSVVEGVDYSFVSLTVRNGLLLPSIVRH